MRRGLAVIGLLVVLNSTGCALFSVVLLPIKLIVAIVGGAFGGAVDVLSDVPSEEAPLVQRVDSDGASDRFAVVGLRREVPCRIVCSAPGCRDVAYDWPRDFDGRGGVVSVLLEPR